MSVIESVAQLRALIGDPPPGLEAKVTGELDDFGRAFIAKSPFLILTTADAAGRLDASPKGDHAGFVEVVDDRTLLIPDRPGNRLAYGHCNIIENPKVSVLFVIPNTPETLRVNGSAELLDDADVLERLSARGKPATLATRVHIEETFFHCAKAFIRSSLWAPESWPERHRVSFGEMFRARSQADESVEKMIDEAVEADYRDNL